MMITSGHQTYESFSECRRPADTFGNSGNTFSCLVPVLLSYMKYHRMVISHDDDDSIQLFGECITFRELRSTFLGSGLSFIFVSSRVALATFFDRMMTCYSAIQILSSFAFCLMQLIIIFSPSSSVYLVVYAPVNPQVISYSHLLVLPAASIHFDRRDIESCSCTHLSSIRADVLFFFPFIRDFHSSPIFQVTGSRIE